VKFATLAKCSQLIEYLPLGKIFCSWRFADKLLRGRVRIRLVVGVKGRDARISKDRLGSTARDIVLYSIIRLWYCFIILGVGFLNELEIVRN